MAYLSPSLILKRLSKRRMPLGPHTKEEVMNAIVCTVWHDLKYLIRLIKCVSILAKMDSSPIDLFLKINPQPGAVLIYTKIPSHRTQSTGFSYQTL